MSKITDRILAVGKTNYDSFAKLLTKQNLWEDFYEFLQGDDVEERFMDVQSWVHRNQKWYSENNPDWPLTHNYTAQFENGRFYMKAEINYGKPIEYGRLIAPLIQEVKIHRVEGTSKITTNPHEVLDKEIADIFYNAVKYKDMPNLLEKDEDGNWQISDSKVGLYLNGEYKEYPRDQVMDVYQKSVDKLYDVAIELQKKLGIYKK